MRIPHENISVQCEKDFLSKDIEARISIAVMALRDEGYRTSKVTVEKTIPASLQDWIKFYARKYLGRWGKRIICKTVSIETHRHEEVWNVCPHEALSPRDSHGRFVMCGSDLSFVSRKYRAAAEEVFFAAIEGAESFYSYPPQPPYRLIRAIDNYKKLDR